MFTRNRSYVLVAAAIISCGANSASADSTWAPNPVSGDWNTAANWIPATVPNGTSDMASFGTSSVTDISSALTVQLAGVIFKPGGSAYTLTGNFAFYINGVVNQSGVTQNIAIIDNLDFTGTCTAGSNLVYTDQGISTGYGIGFYDSSNAESATFVNDGELANGGWVHFDDTSSAANSVIVNEGSVGGATDFFDSSTAANSTITIHGKPHDSLYNSLVRFYNFSRGSNATLIADGGVISFNESSTGDAARVELTNQAELDLTSHSVRGLSIGSLEGDSTGLVSLAALQLTIGGNGLNTTFPGTISGAGSLAKTGSETLTLTGSNTYRGGTTIRSGALLVQAASGSATGPGTVTVNGGTFGGTGNVSGAVTIGTGTSGKATLAPGIKGPGTLTVAKSLIFKSNGNYNFELGLTRNPKADQVGANGVTITSGAKFNLKSRGTATLASGTSFTVISNTSANPISGTFSNLADGSTIIAGNNTLRVSYSGGDGNDLTLTVP